VFILSDSAIDIELVYAEPNRAVVKIFQLIPPATIQDVLRLAAADADFTGIDVGSCAVGVFGRLATLDQALANRDRVEIYRPLAADPKSARRARAREARKKP
jgi:putative ubiquitin-RnfH superfamily antitoxin RatB of RatAB toxin-antitoxin module